VGAHGHVYGFEPDPVARNLLARNVHENRAQNVTILPYAVRAQPGSAWLASERLGNALTSVHPTDGVLEVEAVTLACFCRERDVRPSVVKIDVEGGEASILTAEAEAFISQLRVLVAHLSANWMTYGTRSRLAGDQNGVCLRRAAVAERPCWQATLTRLSFNVQGLPVAEPTASGGEIRAEGQAVGGAPTLS
jgi:FkbM family methyltransferase